MIVDPTPWPGWFSGVLLALLAVLYYAVFRRLPSSSGRYSLLVNRLRHGKPARPPSEDLAVLAAALRSASLEKFGNQALAPPSDSPPRPLSPVRVPVSLRGHGLFLVGLVLGGRLANADARFHWAFHAEPFGLATDSPWLLALLLGGGMLVGFGTRMAGGCTLGHGLCGTPRLQPGSLASTASLFAGGVLLSIGLPWID